MNVPPDGYPRAATAGHADDGLDIAVGMFREAQGVADICRDPRVSLTVNGGRHAWNRIQGPSMSGCAGIMTPAKQRDRANEPMRAEFQQLGGSAADPSMQAKRAASRIPPEVVSMPDYPRRSGDRELVRA
ncbi:MAG TPA: hypothetical protein VFA95_10060 [Gammaproteobacteria bacterium]|nr:hypothetical protein [Gammaproteobacteria bacterium]